MGDTYFRQIDQFLSDADTDAKLFEAIVNAPFQDKVRATKLDLGIVVLLLVNKTQQTIDRISLSNTELAAGAVLMSEKPFHQIKIPLDHHENAIAKAIKTGKPEQVSDWKYLFIPALDPKAARFNQAGAGIEFSCVYPLRSRNGGALIFSFYQVNTNIGGAHADFMKKYSKIVDAHLA